MTERATGTGKSDSGQPHQNCFTNRDKCLSREWYPRLYDQVTSQDVSFDQIAQAWRIANPDSHVKKREMKNRQRISLFLGNVARSKFAEKHGPIEREYWSPTPWAGCALTQDGCVHSVMNVTEPELVLYEDSVHQLCRDAHRAFEEGIRRSGTANKAKRGRKAKRALKAEEDIKEIGQMLYVVLTRMILAASILEDDHKSQEEKDAAFTALRIEWQTMHASVEEMIQRQARFEYLTGVGLGALIAIPVLGAAGWASVSFGANQLSEPGELGALMAAMIGGAAGAVISVTQRMTTKTRTPLVIDFTAKRSQKIALGTLRPIVGAVFGSVVYFAVIGGLLALHANTGHDASIAVAFFAVAGFVAGFSERFAMDVLKRASSGILPSTAPSTQPAEKPDELSRLLSEQPHHVKTPT